MLLHLDLYLATGSKMVDTGCQYDNCDHSEATQNVFEIIFACTSLVFKDYQQKLAVEIKTDVPNFPLRYINRSSLQYPPSHS